MNPIRPKLKFFIQCDQVVQNDGKFSALGFFDAIATASLPATHPSFALFLGLESEGASEAKLQLVVSGPDGEALTEAEATIQLPDARGTANAVFNFQNFPVPAAGAYRCTVFLDGDFFAEHLFRVNLAEAFQPLAPPAPASPPAHTPADIQRLLATPDIITQATAQLNCPKCKHAYIFQHNLDPAAPLMPGHLRFPPGEMFVCGRCYSRVPISGLRENLHGVVGRPKSEVLPPDAQAAGD